MHSLRNFRRGRAYKSVSCESKVKKRQREEFTEKTGKTGRVKKEKKKNRKKRRRAHLASVFGPLDNLASRGSSEEKRENSPKARGSPSEKRRKSIEGALVTGKKKLRNTEKGKGAS